ncbi:hypothetical protein MN116_006498 [Schistosoma mekongi]|uniref:Uncharacterized protein n=1 Tax=Schistosoma mekongi TaxID=38744 RepID=A0AAE2D4H2_SCHME|nr:hypothetical protein MN116_006498 [Schistosoma mekongi]
MIELTNSKSVTSFGCIKSSNKLSQYISEHSLRLSEAQNWLIQETSKHPLSCMLISSIEMQLLSNLCYTINAKMTLDIGVYTGYSALSIAEVLPSHGRVLALDITDAYLQDYCIPAWKKANVYSKIDFRLGPAAQTLQNLIDNGYSGTFDFALIDADKENYSHYYELCLQLIRPRGIIAIDNVLWSLHVLDDNDKRSSTVGIKKLNDYLVKDERIRISLLNIGDGMTIVVKK